MRLPHFGDCTHEGQPSRQRHSPTTRAALATSSAKRSWPRLRDAHAAGVAVVDEHRRAQRLRMDVRREPADVPAVAHREQREHRDQRVLGRVQRAEQVAADLLHQLVRRHEPERARLELPHGQIERDGVEAPLLGQAAPLVGDHLVAHLDDAVGELDAAAQLGLDERAHDARLGLAPRLRVPGAVERRDERDAVGRGRASRRGTSRRGAGRRRPRARSRTRAPARACRAARRSRARRPRSASVEPERSETCAGGRARSAPGQPAGRAHELAGLDERLGRAQRAGAEQLVVARYERQLVRRGAQVADADLGVGRVEDRRLVRAVPAARRGG